MSDGSTMKRTEAISKAEDRWARLDAMTEEEKHAAAMSNPDAQPLIEKDFNSGKLKRTPQVKVIRRALRLSQEEFATRFHIPVGTLRDWEQGRSEPDAPGRAYLIVIARKPDMVRDALEPLELTPSQPK
jgi:putative transcriptional regulator